MYPHCEAAFAQGHNLMLTLFFGALVGSLTHCTSMCGPFVMAQMTGFETPMGTDPKKWTRQLLMPYHFGRLTTYTFLGILATALAAPMLQIPMMHILAPLLLFLAGVVFLLSAFTQIFPNKLLNFNFGLCGAPSWIMQRIAPLLVSNSLSGGYMLGVLLGFLPCGLVYAAIMAVAATGNVLESAFAMIAFALGTMPVMMAMSLGGRVLLAPKYFWVKPVLAVLMVFNSMVLFAMAGKGFV